MKIEEGKYYRTRDGEVVGPAKNRICPDYPWLVGDFTYTKYGAVCYSKSCPQDLIEECNPDGTPIACGSEPIMDNRTVLEKAMREGLRVAVKEYEREYGVKFVGDTLAILTHEGEEFSHLIGIYDVEIVEPKITAEDLCKAIDTIWEHFNASSNGSLGAYFVTKTAKDKADKYRKQQEQK